MNAKARTAAAQLNSRGHELTVFERDEEPGGLLRFGIPDFKLEKWVIDRRLTLLEREGVHLRCGVDAGVDVAGEELLRSFNAVVLATGARVPRDLEIPGRALEGVHFAMDYLYECNGAVASSRPPRDVGRACHPGGRMRRCGDRRRRHRDGLHRQPAPRLRAQRHASGHL